MITDIEKAVSLISQVIITLVGLISIWDRLNGKKSEEWGQRPHSLAYILSWKDMKRKYMLVLFIGFVGIQIANYGITEKILCINIQHSDPMKNIRKFLGVR